MWESRSLPAPLKPQGRFLTETALRRFCARISVFAQLVAPRAAARLVVRGWMSSPPARLALAAGGARVGRQLRSSLHRHGLEALCASVAATVQVVAPRVSLSRPEELEPGASSGHPFTETALRRFCASVAAIAQAGAPHASFPRPWELVPCDRFGSLVTATAFVRVRVRVCLTAQAVMSRAATSLEG